MGGCLKVGGGDVEMETCSGSGEDSMGGHDSRWASAVHGDGDKVHYCLRATNRLRV